MKKNKKKQTEVDFGSYSDLFMVMAFVFLFMYVVASLNNGIQLIQAKHQSQKERQELENKVAKYEQKVEEALTESQKREYEEVKNGLERLQVEAKEARLEQERMAKVALEKEKELVKFQENVKTMAVIQARANEALKEREEKIAQAKEQITERNRTIASLEEDVQEKSTELTRVNQEVQTREQEIEKIQGRVAELSKHAVLAKKQSDELKNLKFDLQSKEKALLAAKQTEEALEKQRDNIAKASQAQLEKAQQEKQILIAAKDQAYSNLEQKYRKATEGLRKEIARSLATQLKAEGIVAHVDKSTGDVTVRFTNAYFDYNSSVLKEAMKKELESFIPIYAKSLFENKKFASSISSIEIVGSASPSFKGQYVNPRNIASDEEKNAMNYNLDLSYRRAKKIFEHTFLTKKFDFQHKQDMVPLVKVIGTGYLQALEDLKELPVEKQDKKKGFCGVYDCEAFQKVTLKFNLKDKVAQQ